MTYPAFNPMPVEGPSIYVVHGFNGAVIPAGGSVGPPGSSATVINSLCEFVFPRDIFVDGLLFSPQSGALADLAALTLRLQDESQEDVIGTGVTLDHTVNGVELFGVAPQFIQVPFPNLRWFKLQRPIKSHDKWLPSIGNVSGAPITLSGLWFRFSEARPAKYSQSANL